MNFKEMLMENRFSLVVSLPSNDLGMAEAALKGGAQAVKVHCNVWHRASGHTFGTFAENRAFLKDLIALCGEVPVGLVPGGEDAFITEEERLELEEMGLGFFSAYTRHIPCHMLDSKKLVRMAAIDDTYDQGILDAVRRSAIDVLECSVQPGERYGQPLDYGDLLRYSDIVDKTGKPCLIPTQKKIRPNEVRRLYQVGCKAVMIGAVVMGREPDAGEVRRAAAAFREAIEAL